MCTIALAFRMRPNVPILVAANRDEYYERPAAPPAWRWDGPIPVLAPQDLERGGTWIGINNRGVFAGLTNRKTDNDTRSPITRGRIVFDALAHPTALGAATALMRTIDPTQYRPFHCVIADRMGALLCWNTGTEMHRQTLAPGFHIITQWSMSAHTRDRDVRAYFPDDVRTAPRKAFERALAAHATDGMHPLDAPCVHRRNVGYGTRSSSLITITEGGTITYGYTDGSPCTTSFERTYALVEGHIEEA